MAWLYGMRILILISVRIDYADSFNLFHIQTKQLSSIAVRTHHFALENDDIATTGGNKIRLPFELGPNDEEYQDLIAVDPSADSVSTLESPMTSRDRLPQVSTKIEETMMSRVTKTASSCTILLLGTFATSYFIGELLVIFEWIQDWRYFWPFIGGWYVADPIMQFWNGSRNQSNPSVLPFDLSKNRGIQFLSVVGGVFTLIGGAYDAFMPVWQTGPNVFTIAGIGQDGAVMLLLVTGLSIIQETWKVQGSAMSQPGNNSNRSLLQILLFTELYKLGESSVDEIVSAVASISNWIG